MPDLAWTREKPTKKGSYVYAETPFVQGKVVKICCDADGELFRYCRVSAIRVPRPTVTRNYKFTEDMPGYWLGPLPTLVEVDAPERSE